MILQEAKRTLRNVHNIINDNYFKHIITALTNFLNSCGENGSYVFKRKRHYVLEHNILILPYELYLGNDKELHFKYLERDDNEFTEDEKDVRINRKDISILLLTLLVTILYDD